jgi:hypothetical protein
MTVTIEAPGLARTAAVAPTSDRGFRVTILGLGGYGSARLSQVTDARLVTVTGTVTRVMAKGRTLLLQLRSADGRTGLISLDMVRALAIPASLYAVGQDVRIGGVARNHSLFASPYVAVRTITAA